jgi:hypothetical protein
MNLEIASPHRKEAAKNAPQRSSDIAGSQSNGRRRWSRKIVGISSRKPGLRRGPVLAYWPKP